MNGIFDIVAAVHSSYHNIVHGGSDETKAGAEPAGALAKTAANSSSTNRRKASLLLRRSDDEGAPRSCANDQRMKQHRIDIVLVPSTVKAAAKRRHQTAAVTATNPGTDRVDAKPDSSTTSAGAAAAADCVDAAGRYLRTGSVLGAGTFGVVECCFDLQTRRLVAVKLFRSDPSRSGSAIEEDWQAEVKAMQTAAAAAAVAVDGDDTAIVVGLFTRILDSFAPPPTKQANANSGLLQHGIVMPLHGPSLAVLSASIFNVARLARVARDAAATLHFFHTRLRVVHTDIKPHNLLLDAPMTAEEAAERVTDANFRVRVCDLAEFPLGCRSSLPVSTRPYRAPESYCCGRITGAADIWSLGCTLFQLAASNRLLFPLSASSSSSSAPMEGARHLRDMELVAGETLPNSLLLKPDRMPKDLLQAYQKLQPPPPLLPGSHASSVLLQRLQAGNAQQLQLFADLLAGMLRLDPAARLTAQQVMGHPFVIQHLKS